MKNLARRESSSIQKRESNSIGSYRPNLPDFPFRDREEIPETKFNKELVLMLFFCALMGGALMATVSELRPDRFLVGAIPISLALAYGLRVLGVL